MGVGLITRVNSFRSVESCIGYGWVGVGSSRICICKNKYFGRCGYDFGDGPRPETAGSFGTLIDGNSVVSFFFHSFLRSVVFIFLQTQYGGCGSRRWLRVSFTWLCSVETWGRWEFADNIPTKIERNNAIISIEQLN
ncbi:hypothetical protein Csa_000887 [Cucumis sativus]|uniref:Uncharacterized protein n=1 Tax=Cucumis sativus TaxID=3659 RepID=A0A0A0LCV2_CUCSA|nr:hypothetical protein Csa_000887 [Cucumis sativus]